MLNVALLPKAELNELKQILEDKEEKLLALEATLNARQKNGACSDLDAGNK
jgi:hypothetical protein